MGLKHKINKVIIIGGYMSTIKFLLSIISKATDKGIKQEITKQRSEIFETRRLLFMEYKSILRNFSKHIDFRDFQPDIFDLRLDEIDCFGSLQIHLTSNLVTQANNKKVKEVLNRLEVEIKELSDLLNDLDDRSSSD